MLQDDLQHQLTEAERRLRQTFASLNEAVFVVDARTRSIVDCNPAAERIFGYSREELIGTATALLHVSPERHAAFARDFDPALLRDGAVELDWEMRRKDGSTFESQHTVTLLDPGAGMDQCVVSVVRDVSVQRALERQLRHAQKMEAAGSIAAGVAHDFNNLLTVIRGHTEMLRGDLPPDSPLVADTDQILGAVERGTSLTRDLLTFSRRQVLDERVVSLAEMIRRMEPTLRRVIPATVTLRLDAPDAGLEVRVDESQMQQVVLNLIVNAVQALRSEGDGAMQGKGTIWIHLDTVDTGRSPRVAAPEPARAIAPGRYVRFVVEDSGPGIAPEALERIFEPFFTTKPRGEGTGLGLAMAYGIVTQCKGRILAGNGEEGGARFTILLPLVGGAVAP
jgi:two-component system, cell cycle sensor histidine kinase and response regulator CckA